MMFPTPTLKDARTKELNPRLRAEIIAVCLAAFKEDDFNNLFSYVPTGGWHFMAYEAGVLVSHAMVTTRWLQPAGSLPLRTAFVDAVACLPDRQGRGYASAVMRRLAQSVAAVYSIACLQTERESFYARLGWLLWQGPLAGRRGDVLVPTPDQRGVMVLPLPKSPPLDNSSLLSIECQKTRIW